MTAAIEVQGLQKSFGRQRVLHDLDLIVDGGVVALLGPNGAGKSTLVSILTTILRPDAGIVRVQGYDAVGEARAVRALLRVTGQSPSLDELLSGRDNLVILGKLLGLGRRSARRADEMLERLNLADAGRKPVRSYSGGECAAGSISRRASSPPPRC